MATEVRQVAATGFSFSTDASEVLPEFIRREQWAQVLGGLYGPIDFKFSQTEPLSARLQARRLDNIAVAACSSNIGCFNRTAQCAAQVGSDDFQLVVNLGHAPLGVSHLGQDADLAPGAMTLLDDERPGAMRPAAGSAWALVQLARRPLLDLVGDAAHARLMRALPPSDRRVQHLLGYLRLILDSQDGAEDHSLHVHIGTTLMDLAGLVLGSQGERGERAQVRGVRAARLRAALEALRVGYRKPGFSVVQVAAQMGCSTRYVQALMSEAGASFTERLTELRLQRARVLLSDFAHDALRIRDIARASGFSDVNHFNRAFKHRFQVSPTELRRDGRVGGQVQVLATADQGKPN